MKIRKDCGIAQTIINTEKKFGERESYFGAWINIGGESKYIFLSEYEIERFNNRTIKRPDLVLPKKKRFLFFFKKGKANLGEVFTIQNKDKKHIAEADEYLGLWIRMRSIDLFLLLTNDDYLKILDRSKNNQEDVPTCTYE